LKKTIPYIAIIGIAAFAGNMINIGLSYGMHWLSLDPIAFMESFNWSIILTLPLSSTSIVNFTFSAISIVF